MVTHIKVAFKKPFHRGPVYILMEVTFRGDATWYGILHDKNIAPDKCNYFRAGEDSAVGNINARPTHLKMSGVTSEWEPVPFVVTVFQGLTHAVCIESIKYLIKYFQTVSWATSASICKYVGNLSNPHGNTDSVVG